MDLLLNIAIFIAAPFALASLAVLVVSFFIPPTEPKTSPAEGTSANEGTSADEKFGLAPDLLKAEPASSPVDSLEDKP